MRLCAVVPSGCGCALYPLTFLPHAYPTSPRALHAQAVFGSRACPSAHQMTFYLLFLLLAHCSGLTTSPTTSPSSSPCSAPPGAFCSNGTVLLCPIGAYCAGGAALNVSCYPVTACTVTGLSAQPPCYWNVSTLAGSGNAAFADGVGTLASFNQPRGLSMDVNSSSLLIGDMNNCRVRRVSFHGVVSTVAGGACGYANGMGTSAMFERVNGVLLNATSLDLYVADFGGCVRKISAAGSVTLFAGSCTATGSANGVGNTARFYYPTSLAFGSGPLLLLSDAANYVIRQIDVRTATVSTLAGSGVSAAVDGIGASASVKSVEGITAFTNGTGLFPDLGAYTIRTVSPGGIVTTVAGSGTSGCIDGPAAIASFGAPFSATIDHFENVFVTDQLCNSVRVLAGGRVFRIAGTGAASSTRGFSATLHAPSGIAVSLLGVVFVVEQLGNKISKLTCVPCPASYYCFSGAPVLCPAGSYCPLSSINATLCPKGSYSNAGASICTICPAGTFSSAPGSTSCQQCPGGHFCPPGTSSWARLNCGRGNYCPDGSGAPTPCPYQVPPSGGWGALQVQGPAFLVETAHCLNHCFWNFTSGDGVLSKC